MKAHKLPYISISEYKEIEEQSGVKHEYHNGEVFALAGGTINHTKICGNIYVVLRTNMKHKETQCEAFTSELKIFIEAKNSFVYPDATVVCGKQEVSLKDEQAITNPILIVEVLSKSTAEYDRGDKFFMYRQLPSLIEYVLIEQEKYVVEVYTKQIDTDLWKISRYEGIDNTVSFDSLKINVPMADIYEGVAIDMK